MPIAALLRLLLVSLFAVTLHETACAAGDVLRIRLFEAEQPARLMLGAENGNLEIYVDGVSVPVAELADGESVWIEARDDELHAALSSDGIYSLALRVRPTGSARSLVLRIGERVPAEPLVLEGRLTFLLDPARAGELLVVNEVDLERYVAERVDEVYGLDALEGAKAFAVAVRTQAIRSSGMHNGLYDLVEHAPVTGYGRPGNSDPTAVEAARETAGELLAFRGDLIESLYFASSGGHTADNEYVWDSEPRPYLRGKPDPFDADPNRNWKTTISIEELLAALTSHYGFSVVGFLVEERSADGRARVIALVLPDDERRYVSGAAFRDVVNRTFGDASLRSTNFTAVRTYDEYLFEGVGSGHGVGLPRWGAYGLAMRGRGYRDILGYYYTDAEVVRQEDFATTNRPSTEIAQTSLPVDSEHSLPAVEKVPPRDTTPEANAGPSRPLDPDPDTVTTAVPDHERPESTQPSTDAPARIGW